ncbi:putative zinc finger, PHD-type containing protein [Tanacetum coccineum]
MKKVQLLCNACVRPITSAPFYKCVNDDCNFVLHEWCTQLPTQVEKYPVSYLNTSHTKLIKITSFLVLLKESTEERVICVEITFLLTNVHSLCGVGVHVGCALLLPAEIRHKYDKHPMRLNYLPIENHKSDYFCEICEDELNPEKCFYHCYECAQSVHIVCAPHILQSETSSSSYYYSLRGPYMFVNVKFGGIHKFKHHPHPLSFVQGIESDGRCTACGYKVRKYDLILKCQECKFVIDLYCLSAQLEE